jgi:hypothetical protein
MQITKAQAIDYLNSLGDTVDDLDYMSLEDIREEVLRGDRYDGMNIWGRMLEHYNAEDISSMHDCENCGKSCNSQFPKCYTCTYEVKK